MSSVKDGVGLVERAAGLAGEVEGAGSGVAAAGGVLAEVAEEVKGALEAGQALFAAAVALLPGQPASSRGPAPRRVWKLGGRVTRVGAGLIEMLPKMIKEMQDFFVPTGLVAMLLKPSNQLRNIIDAVTSLQSAVPRPDQVPLSFSLSPSLLPPSPFPSPSPSFSFPLCLLLLTPSS